MDNVLSVVSALARGGKGPRQIPPVESWHPEKCGGIGMEIRADGSWWHEGGIIARRRLVELFSTILRKDEDGTTWLVTPAERVVVHVEDAHFLAVRMDVIGAPGRGQQIAFTTQLGDVTLAGPEHPMRIEIDPETGEPSPYVNVRGRLEAKLTRAVFHELAGHAVPGDGAAAGQLGVWSGGAFYVLGPAADGDG